MPNALAWLMLLLCFPVVIALIATRGPVLGVAIGLTGSAFLLPSAMGLDLPGLPQLDRLTLPLTASLVGLLIFAPSRIRLGGLPPFVLALFTLLLISPFITVYANPDAIVVGERFMPGLTINDGASLAIRNLFRFILPFGIGYFVIRRPAQLVPIIAVLVGAMLLYSVLILWESRMSPRLHRMLYGFHQHNFGQTRRGDGWRPTVFMSAGLELALFVSVSAMAAAFLATIRERILGIPTKIVAGYLAVVLVVCKSLASLLYGLVGVPLLTLLRPRVQLRAAAAITLVVLLYPPLRFSGAFPADTLVSVAESISPERAHSLDFRFRNDEQLVQRASQRLLAGWGGWGRSLEYHYATGRQTTIADGFWIVILGGQGVLGFIGTFGLLLSPIWVAWRKGRRIHSPLDQRLVAATAWIVAILSLDMLPNAMPNALTFFLPGALLGAVRSTNRIGANMESDAPHRPFEPVGAARTIPSRDE